jgi:prostamide/prostaglandin F2alpha synthase
VQLHRARAQFRATGGDLVLIGQATPRHAAHFRRRHTPALPVLADEERASYRAVGAGRMKVTEVLNPLVAAKSLRATARSGAVQGRVIGDAAQLGGSMVVRPDGSVAWSRMARDIADNPSVEELVEALRAAVGARR